MNNDNKLNSIDYQEDFFSFGDFTSDELNIYLNKSNNNTTTTPPTTTSINLNELKSNSFKATKTNFIPNINTNCNSFLHGVEVPWHINNNNKEENINNKQIFEFRSNSITSPSSSSSKREESKSSSNNSSSLNSPFDSFDSSNKLIKMNTQITTNSNDLAAQAAANEAAQQRRNKKKKPPNYYENPEYKDILKTTTDESTTNITNPPPTTNTTTTTLINSITSNNNNNNESSNDLKKESVVNNLDNQIINNISAKLLNSNINEIKTNNLNNSEHHHLNNNINKNESENIVNEPEEEKKQPQKEVLKTNDLENKLTNHTKTTQTNDNSQDKSNNNTTNSSSKCWSSLFKSSAAAAATTTVTLPPVPVSQNNNNNNKQTKVNHNNSKPSLSSSASLPISPSSSVSSSSSSLSSSTTHNNINNHVHLNGTSTTTTATTNNNNNNNIAATSASSEQSSHDVLKMLGTMFKQCELKHSAPALQPRGIRNKQNWCYVNATLQALLACPPFYNLIKSIFMKIKSSNTNIKNVPCIAALGRFISEFKTMVRLQPQNDKQSNNNNSSSNFSNYKELVIGEPFENEFFYETLANLKAELTFKTGRQEDAQEFLSFLLNRLHDEMVRCLESLNATNNETNNNIDHSKTNGSSVHNNNNHQDEQQADEDDEWKEVGKKNRSFVTRKTEFKQSPLSDIFCGQFRSALSQPGVKDKESVSLEPFFTLPLDIQPDSVRNVQQALEHFVQKEEVFGFTNQDTKQEIEAFKRISFEDLPPVLILYLKCFVFDKQGGIQKLIKRIDFQIDLEINKELISPNQRSKLRDKKRNYKLFAVEYHQGDKANGGHYITDVYHPGIIGWVRYDDANVKVINNAQVLKSEDKKLIPYLLYYRRADLI